jgi:tetratricopeptide (TPR) repeat protein
MTEEELIEMTTLKIKGLVEETARELVAKAQLKKGDIYASRDMIEEALAAYEVVPERYSSETVLVENSHYKVAELIHKTRGLDAAISSYKSAITNVESRRFQAKTQLTAARLLFDAGRYDQAAAEYRVYLSAYPDQAARLGF